MNSVCLLRIERHCITALQFIYKNKMRNAYKFLGETGRCRV